MSKKQFFPPRPRTNSTIYAYELIGVNTHAGLLKIGYIDRDAQTRVAEQQEASMKALMNYAVYKFKRYEDDSLTYTGINKKEGENIGLYNTVLRREDVVREFENEEYVNTKV